VQSHVVHGYVGQKAATFPLQLLGFDVDPLNTVHFSNHTGYEYVRGQKLDADQMSTIVEGLRLNDLLRKSTHVLSGYMGSAAMLHGVLTTLDALRKLRKEVFYVCDTVLGDLGRLYVPEELIAEYRDEAVPRANLLTPNSFEASLLTGIEINTEADALRACDDIHRRGCNAVVITSMPLPDDDTHLLLLGSEIRDNEKKRFRLLMPLVKGYFTGTGDLIAALLLAHTAHGAPLATAVERAVATLQAVLQRTIAAGGGELQLISSRDDILNPTITLYTEQIN